MKLLSKISAKDVLVSVNDVVVDMDIGDIILAYGVVGKCSAYETGVSHFGEWVRFVGDFIATNYVTGEEIRSPKAYIPDVLEKLLLEGIGDKVEIESAKSTKFTTFYNMADSVEFAYTVSIERLQNDDKGGVSYRYIVSPKMEVKASDAISHLMKLIPSPSDVLDSKKTADVDTIESSDEPEPKKKPGVGASTAAKKK